MSRLEAVTHRQTKMKSIGYGGEMRSDVKENICRDRREGR